MPRFRPFLFALSACLVAGLSAQTGETPAVPIQLPPAATTTPPATPTEATPAALPGAERFVYRTVGDVELGMFVVRPAGWKASDRRVGFLFFFGGGWTRGTPERSVGWARWAAQQGLVGLAPDYRVRTRHGTSPLESVSDGRAALRWAQEHAAELGLDPTRIVVGGSSAGGHLALWTGLRASPPGSSAELAPLHLPLGLYLSSPVSDTAPDTGYTPQRFGEHAVALSPLRHLEDTLPPVLMLHGDADKTVPYASAQAFAAAAQARQLPVTLVTVPGGSHGFTTDLPEWRDRSRALLRDFLVHLGALAR